MSEYLIKRNTLSGVEVYLRTSDMSWFQADPDNLDYQLYLVWLGEGNTAEEWNPEEPSGSE